MAYLEPITSLQDPVDEPVEDRLGARLGTLRLAILLAALVLVGRLAHLQIVQGAFYREYADDNRFRATRVEASRGVIFDRKGALLARNRPRYAAAIIQADLPPQPRPVYRRLGRMLELSPEEVEARLKAGLPRYGSFTPIIIRENIGEELALILEERYRELPGVHIVGQSVREYVDGPLTAHVLGYMGAISAEQLEALKRDHERKYQGDDWIGQVNVEGLYEADLRGFPGQRLTEVDFFGREVRLLEATPSKPGNNVTLTLDFELQRVVAGLLGARLGEHGAASAVVLDPRNGQVLALVSLPSYDASMFSRGITEPELQAILGDPRAPLVDGAIAAAHPPGAVFHPITAAGALQEGVLRADQRLDCPQALTIPGRLDSSFGVRFAGSGARGEQDVVSALAISCETFFYQVGGGDAEGRTSGLGAAGLRKHAEGFGLGERAGIGLAGEEAGSLQTRLRDWYKGDSYLLATGQQYVAVTPLQLANAYAAIANDGVLYQPQLVLQVADSAGQVQRAFHPLELRRVPVAPQHLAVVREGLRAAFQTGQTRNAVAYEGILGGLEAQGLELAGIASTVDGTGGGSVKRTRGWFAGFGPASNPRAVVAVFVEQGRGEDAAALGRAILSYYLGR